VYRCFGGHAGLRREGLHRYGKVFEAQHGVPHLVAILAEVHRSRRNEDAEKGKTALSCHLVSERGYVHHLIHRTGGRSDSRLILRSLAGQLLPLAGREETLPEATSELAKTFDTGLRRTYFLLLGL